MGTPAILNSWADALTIEARSLPSPQMITSLRPGNDPVTIRLGDGQLIDDPVWGTLCMWVDKMNFRDLLKKIANRRGTCIDVTLSGQVFMKRRAGLAIFSHLAPRTDSTLFSVRNHELWKSGSADFLCQGCHKPMTDHHFAYAQCTQNLPSWSSIVPELTAIATRVNIPLDLHWFRYGCQDPTGPPRGCDLHPTLGDYTCLNTFMAEIPSSVADWCNQSSVRPTVVKAILGIQLKIATHVAKRRELLYPKGFHPL